jgi:predicted nucleic acid-binding protein
VNFVLDASVALSWCFEDEREAYGVRVLEGLRTSEAVAASIWPLEIANGLLTAERRGRLTPADAAAFTRLLLSLPIAVEPVERRALETTFSVGRRRRLSAYDAAYLDLAAGLAIPLATLDDRLRVAARAEGVAIFEA